MTYQGSWHVGPYSVYPVLGGIPLMARPLIDWLQMGKRRVGRRASSCAAAMASMAAPTGRTGSHMPLSGGGCSFSYSYAPTQQVRTAVEPRCHPEIRRQRHTIPSAKMILGVSSHENL
jgi:hypothetical protein